MVFAIGHIDYLQRRVLLPGVPASDSAPARLRLIRVARVARPATAASMDAAVSPSRELIVGMYGLKIPIAFLLTGGPEGSSLVLAVWSRAATVDADPKLNVWSDILQSVAAATYPGFAAATMEPPRLQFPRAAIALGVPSYTRDRTGSGLLPVERVFRACRQPPSGVTEPPSQWHAMVIAEPVDESVVAERRQALLGELLEMRAAAGSSQGVRSPMLELYMKLLEAALGQAERGLADGAWRTAVYLLGDGVALPRLMSAWRSTFQGEESLPEPLRVFRRDDCAPAATSWLMPEGALEGAPGIPTHPFALQTLLTSEQLASYIHLPSHELSALAVRPLPRFNVVPPATDATGNAGKIDVGAVLDMLELSGNRYTVSLGDLTRHVLVTGMTGSGKTNTLKGLLLQLDAAGVPFLVIEPAKKEYRQLAGYPGIASRLRVFTLGDETVAPFRVNPFEVIRHTPVSAHIDLLRALFVASFGMWTPLPQILEQCLHAVYEDQGWDIAQNRNKRLADGKRAAAFPTLSDLVRKVDEVTAELGYRGEFTADVRAALLTRLNSLRRGAKGRMLDVRFSVPMPALLEAPTVIELEDIGDDDDKAFLIGLLLIRLVEQCRAVAAEPHAQRNPEVRHVIVFEEAHRLFTKSGPVAGGDEAQPRAKAVEMFANLLAEVRAYQQAVFIADQVPTKLAPDVIKNTNLKVVHRLVDREDRLAMAGAMAMDEEQARCLAGFRRNRGEAAVFGEGDDGPMMVRVEKLRQPQEEMDDTALKHMARQVRCCEGIRDAYRSYTACGTLCQKLKEDDRASCQGVRALLDSTRLRDNLNAVFLSLLSPWEGRTAADVLLELCPTLNEIWRARTLCSEAELATRHCLLVHAIHDYFTELGKQRLWEYAQTDILVENFLSAVPWLTKCAGPDEGEAPELEAAAAHYRQLCGRPGPFIPCPSVCGDECLYRFAVVPSTRIRDLADRLAGATRSVESDPALAARELAEVTDRLLDRTIVVAHVAARARLGACFIIQGTDLLEDEASWRRIQLARALIELIPGMGAQSDAATD